MDQLYSVLMRVTEAEEDGNVCNSVSKSLKGWRRQLTGGRSRNLLRSAINLEWVTQPEPERWEEQETVPKAFLMAPLRSLAPSDFGPLHMNLTSSAHSEMRNEAMAYAEFRTGTRFSCHLARVCRDES